MDFLLVVKDEIWQSSGAFKYSRYHLQRHMHIVFCCIGWRSRSLGGAVSSCESVCCDYVGCYRLKPRRHFHSELKLEPMLCTLMHLYLVKAMEMRN